MQIQRQKRNANRKVKEAFCYDKEENTKTKLDFIWVHFYLLFLFSLSTRCIFSVSLKCCIIYMLGLHSVCLNHIFWVLKILGWKKKP